MADKPGGQSAEMAAIAVLLRFRAYMRAIEAVSIAVSTLRGDAGNEKELPVDASPAAPLRLGSCRLVGLRFQPLDEVL